MSRLLVGLLLLASGSVALADDDPEPPKPPEDLKKFQGTWDVVKYVRDRQDESARFKEDGAHAIIKKNRFEFVHGKGKGYQDMRFTLDAKKKPARIDVRDRNQTSRAIYKFENGELTIAWNEPGRKRPPAFDKSDGLLVFKRRAAKK